MSGVPGRSGRLLWAAGLALGVAAEAVSYELGDARHWLPDLAVGWTLIGCGLIAWSQRELRSGLTGPLLAAAGCAWFAANFWGGAIYLHRGPLVQLVLCYPRGWPAGRIERGAVTAAYAAAVATPVWSSDAATLVVAGAIAAIALHGHISSAGLRRRARLPGTVAAAGLAFVLAAAAIARIAAGPAEVSGPVLLGYQLALCALAAGLLVGLDHVASERTAVADLVIDIGIASGTLREALARALGDPTLDIGFWVPAVGAYVDGAGRPLALPPASSGRTVTRLLDRSGRPVAALVHDPAALDDPGLIDALATAARLAAANARLQTDVRHQVAEVDASRRRLVRAGDDERRRLAQRLDSGAQRRLTVLASALREARTDASTGATADRIERASDQLAQTLTELGELAAGLHPSVLTRVGLRGALVALGARCPVPVEVVVAAEDVSVEVEATIYFLCSEALANVAKHAHASTAAIAVTASRGQIVVRISDDGVGGADAAAGSGLRGLTDRIEALGGRLEIIAPRGHGTALVARLPAAITATGDG